jgi:hypothetical protein
MMKLVDIRDCGYQWKQRQRIPRPFDARRERDREIR